jgi:hypothetical protein
MLLAKSVVTRIFANRAKPCGPYVQQTWRFMDIALPGLISTMSTRKDYSLAH